MYKRILEDTLADGLRPGKVMVLFGARRTGKTVLLQQLKDRLSMKKILQLNGEDYDIAALFSSRRQSVFKNLVAGYDFIFLDEAQVIPQIGESLKLMIDSNPGIGILVTGSSSFDLRNKIGEPLTGRALHNHLYPLSVAEITTDYLTLIQTLPSLLVYGSYPQVFLANSNQEKRLELEGIRNGYLLKDVLQLDNVKDSLFVMNLLRSLAFQIGNDVSLNELATANQTTVKTIQRYLDILEKAFIIFRLYGFSRNMRKEISKSPRFYFWDNGIRNSIISRFEQIDLRDDKGKLWENFCIAERIKKQKYARSFNAFYFWRTYDQQEIDLIEESEHEIMAFEFNYNEGKVRIPAGFIANYPKAAFNMINQQNVYDFLIRM